MLHTILVCTHKLEQWLTRTLQLPNVLKLPQVLLIYLQRVKFIGVHGMSLKETHDFPRHLEWVTLKGDRVRLCDMGTSHVENSLDFVGRQLAINFYKKEPRKVLMEMWVLLFTLELEYRGTLKR